MNFEIFDDQSCAAFRTGLVRRVVPNRYWTSGGFLALSNSGAPYSVWEEPARSQPLFVVGSLLYPARAGPAGWLAGHGGGTVLCRVHTITGS